MKGFDSESKHMGIRGFNMLIPTFDFGFDAYNFYNYIEFFPFYS